MDRYGTRDLNDKPLRTVFVGGIPLDIRVKELMAYLSEFDAVVKLQLPKDPNTGALKGYAKAIFATTAGVERITSQAHHELKGLKIGILRWQNQATYTTLRDQLIERKVHIRLPAEITAEKLSNYFRKFPGLEEVILKKHPVTKKPRNFCYIVFRTKEDARTVVNEGPHYVEGILLQCSISRQPKKISGSKPESGTGSKKREYAYNASKPTGANAIEMKGMPQVLNASDMDNLSRKRDSAKSQQDPIRSGGMPVVQDQLKLTFAKPTSKDYYCARQSFRDYFQTQSEPVNLLFRLTTGSQRVHVYRR